VREKVVIVGGGASGLAAASELAETHSVTVLEARRRFGGRIFTGRDNPHGVAFELGAEFIHGKAPETWRFIKAAGLSVHEVPDRHWAPRPGGWVEVKDFWDQLAKITEEIKPNQPDQSFARFLRQLRRPAEATRLALGFIEGFHAAPADRASIQAVRLSEESSEEINGDRQLRINEGYDRIVQFLQSECRRRGATLLAGADVRVIDWSREPLVVRTSDGAEFTAQRVIVTAPVGVLKSGAIDFHPKPASKIDAIQSLDMGAVTKVVLAFKERFWPEPNFGFVHSDDEWFPTWWADQRGPILTAWAGGPAGEKVSHFERDFIIGRALETASRLFSVTLPQVRAALLSAHTHNWMRDPWSRGAYSYIPVNAIDACRELARPEQGKLFFAGEATALNYQFGTVHGALASAFRVARDIRSLERPAS
jgi:monoamine oxidase